MCRCLPRHPARQAPPIAFDDTVPELLRILRYAAAHDERQQLMNRPYDQAGELPQRLQGWAAARDHVALGNLSSPRMAPGQKQPSYSTRRASLISPLEGDLLAQVVKVDPRNSLAQIFELAENGHLVAASDIIDVSDLISQVLELYPGEMPPPKVWELEQ